MNTQVSVSRKRFQIVLMATGAFAVPSIRLLCEESAFDIICLVTNPQRYDRHGKPIITPARQAAEEYNIPISDKEDIHSQEFFDFLYLVRPDLLFVCDFGQILPRQALEGSLLGGVNLHGSLLPKFRGAAPVHWAILDGEQYTGVSIIHMTPKVDAGPVIAQSPPIPIGSRETAAELEERLAEYGAELVFDVVKQMANNGTVKIIEQFHEKASKAPRLKKESGLVPWYKTASEVYNHFRAMEPWPRSFTDWHRNDGSVLRLILGQIVPLSNDLKEVYRNDFLDSPFVDPVLMDAKMNNLADLIAERQKKSPQEKMPWKPPQKPSSVGQPPGTVVRAEEDELIIATQEGAVKITAIQPAGKKMMLVKDFLRGYPMKPGDRLE